MTAHSVAIADAAIRVIVHQGFDVVSVRKVAAEAGVSAGTVQYFMGTRNEMLQKALQRSVARQHQRVTERLASTPADILDRLHTALMELLPTGEMQREDAALWVVLGAASSTRSELAQLYQQELRVFQQRLSQALAQQAAVTHGRGHAGDIALTSRLITALVNGLTLDYLNAPVSATTSHMIDHDLKSGLRRILQQPSA